MKFIHVSVYGVSLIIQLAVVGNQGLGFFFLIVECCLGGFITSGDGNPAQGFFCNHEQRILYKDKDRVSYSTY